ncbi:MAG: STAS domain-containing protein [Ruminococcaceae bacterium]|nr:STAS domain-containing protein [Oscillospiraceae bacterium]
MPVTIQAEERTLTALLEGEIDHHTAKAMREEIDSAAVRMEPKLLRLDFSRVGFMDSSGIGLIMGRFRLMKESGGSVEVINVPIGMAKMMRLAGLGRLGIKGIE